MRASSLNFDVYRFGFCLEDCTRIAVNPINGYTIEFGSNKLVFQRYRIRVYGKAYRWTGSAESAVNALKRAGLLELHNYEPRINIMLDRYNNSPFTYHSERREIEHDDNILRWFKAKKMLSGIKIN